MIGQAKVFIQKLENYKYFGIFFVAAIFVLSGFSEIKAQDFGRVPITVASKGGSTTRTKVRTVRVVQVKTVVKEVKTTKIVPVRTSNLIVTTQVGAKVVIEQLGKDNAVIDSLTDVSKLDDSVVSTDDDEQQDDDEKMGAAEFEGIKPGKYKITSSLSGYDSSETIVEIEKEKTSGVPLTLEPYSFELTIETNVLEGEVRYAPAEFIRRDGNLLITKEKRGYCIALIVRNGNKGYATIKGLKKGYYNLDIRPSANNIEFQPRFTVLELPNNLSVDATGKTVTSQSYEIELEKKISTGTFSTSWTSAEWNLPTGWRLGNSLKTNRTAGVALPKNEQYRYYTNFEMISDVTSQDDNTVGFVLRAQDEKNYYLIQIAGAKAPEPFVAKGFIVRNGEFQQIFSNPIPHFAKTIASGKSFRVIIKGKENNTPEKENVFEVYIEDSSTADLKPLGNIIDRYKVYNKGAVGIAVANNSNFEVASFTVCASICR